MIKHYFKIIFRNIIRNKLYTLINLVGLSSGIAAGLILLTYIQHELSFDQFHKNKNQIYRITTHGINSGENYAKGPYKLAPLLKSSLPEVQDFCRIKEKEYTVKKDGVSFQSEKFILTDSSFFNIFSIKIFVGDVVAALNNPDAVILTKSMAEKYFHDQNPIGEILEITHMNKIHHQQVSAVVEDFPNNFHIQAGFILPISSSLWDFPKGQERWHGYWEETAFLNYLLLPQNYDPQVLTKKIPALIATQTRKNFEYSYKLQPLNRIHLYSDYLSNDVKSKGNLKQIYLFGIITALILLIAIFNYIILSTAQSLKRAKEIGLRKVIGANRSKIMKQVLGESTFMSFLSLPLALILAYIFLPKINELIGVSLHIDLMANIYLLPGLFLVCTISGLISGSYIAFYLSSFKPIEVFRSRIHSGKQGGYIQKVLVAMQLIIFVGLIICAGIIYSQVKYMKNNLNLGFDKENLISIDIPDPDSFGEKYSSFKNSLLSNPGILFVSASSTTQHPAFSTKKIAVKLIIDPVTKIRRLAIMPFTAENSEGMIVYETNNVDADYIATMGMKITEGKTFDQSDVLNRSAVIVNEQFLKEFNIENPLDGTGEFLGGKINIVGVVKDYHNNSFTEKVGPVLLKCNINSKGIMQVIIRTSGKNTAETLAFISEEWAKFSMDQPFQYHFNNTYIENMYKTEFNLSKLIGSFAVLAIVIASFGLFGLSFSTAQNKTKEIVIRKTMGASVMNIIIRLIRQFLGITIIANIIAMPISYYYMGKWLQNFEYQSMIDYWIFVLAGISSLVLCLLTVFFHSAKAAIINPVEALKYE